LLKASICVFNKKINFIEQVAKAFLLCKVKSNLTFNASLLLLSTLTLLLFKLFSFAIRLILEFSIIYIATFVICFFNFSTIKIIFLRIIYTSYCKYRNKVRKFDCLKSVKLNKYSKSLSLLFVKRDNNKTNKILINLTTIFSHKKDILLIIVT